MLKNPFYILLAVIVFIPQVLFVLFFPDRLWGGLYLFLTLLAFFLHLKGERNKLLSLFAFLPALIFIPFHLSLNYVVEDLFLISSAFVVFFLLSEKSSRNYLYINLLSFLNLALVSVNFQNLSYGILLLVYLFGLVYLFLLLPLEAFKKELPRRVYLWLLKYSSVVYGVIFLFGAVLFFILPRPSQPIFALFQKELPSAKIGFSSDVSLGSFSSVAEDNTVVFRAKLSVKPQNLYWRGNTLELFRNRVWFSYPAPYAFYTLNATARLVKEEILLNPYGDNVIFTYLYPIRLVHSNIRVLINRAKGTLKALQSITDSVKVELLASSDIKVFLRKRNILLEVPRDLRPLLGEIVETYRLKGKTFEETLRRLGLYFSKFRYSRESPAKNLEEFLLKYRKGDCEYFATAAALLLRYMGYPTRLVVGFHGGEYNPVTQFYVVRQKDAHAWVEVYYNHRWVRFDGTVYAVPPQGKTETAQNVKRKQETPSPLFIFWDTLNTLWLEYVVNLTKGKQLNLWKKISSQLKQIQREHLTTLLIGFTLASLLLLFYLVRKMFPSLPVSIYLRLKYGIRVSPSMTPLEVYNYLWRRYPHIWEREKRKLV